MNLMALVSKSFIVYNILFLKYIFPFTTKGKVVESQGWS